MNKPMPTEKKELTERQIELCAHLDSMDQIHLVDPEIREKYYQALRAYQVQMAGIEIKK